MPTYIDENYFPEGMLINDRYEVVEFIGKGGMGIVYLVKDTIHENMLMALKTIKPDLIRDEERADQLKHEATIAQQLTHHNIVRVHNYAEWRDIPYILMEFIDGKSLEKTIYERNKFKFEDFILLTEGICRGLDHAHKYKQKYIHRDLKPSNILITKEGIPKIADFGIAMIFRASTYQKHKKSK